MNFYRIFYLWVTSPNFCRLVFAMRTGFLFSNIFRTYSTSVKNEIGRFDSNLPLEGASTPPSSWYLSEDIYRSEQEKIFHNHFSIGRSIFVPISNWSVRVSRVDELSSINKFITRDYYDAKGREEKSILITRSSQSLLKGFHNICRHKGAKLVDEVFNGHR